eukprot:scaffold46010_cov60-Phaeocystis_antarctica.AAC.4
MGRESTRRLTLRAMPEVRARTAQSRRGTWLRRAAPLAPQPSATVRAPLLDAAQARATARCAESRHAPHLQCAAAGACARAR